MLIEKPNADAVRAYRDEKQCSMQEAKAAVIAHWKLETLQLLRRKAGELHTVDQCQEVLAPLIDYLIEDLVS